MTHPLYDEWYCGVELFYDRMPEWVNDSAARQAAFEKWLEGRPSDRAVMFCPECDRQHLDGRWWAHKPHITHHCMFKSCKHVWDSERPMIGVRANS